MNASNLAKILVLTLLGAATAPAAAITNGSFESPALSVDSYCISFTSPACGVVSGWTGGFYVANGNGAISAVDAPPDGSQYAMLQGAGSSLEQSLNVGQAGSYTLSWFDAGRVGFIGASGNQTYNVLFDGNLLGTFSTTTGSLWAAHSLNFSSGVGTFTLKFAGTSSQGDQSALIDKVSLGEAALTPSPTGTVPEPATFALAGVALCVVFGRRLYRLNPRR